MIRTVLAAGVVLAVGIGVVASEESPIKARQALMKANGDQAKIAAAMAKGEKPFDLAAAKKVFATFANAAAKVPALFPPTSKTGEDTAALPAIWENMDDFKARLAKLGEDSRAAEASVTDLATFKTALGTVGKDCGGCHEKYRQKKT